MSNDGQPFNQDVTLNQQSNQGFNGTGALAIRLDTETLIDRFDKYLRGVDTRLVEDGEGVLRVQTIWKGKPLVNDVGYQAVMRWIHLIINTHTLQGNFLTEEAYGDYMCNLHADFIIDLIDNRHRYGITVSDANNLCNVFSDSAALILTRPIFNKEREGMNNTTKISESVQTHPQNNGFFSNPFGGRK
jgi:hypothetical protein